MVGFLAALTNNPTAGTILYNVVAALLLFSKVGSLKILETAATMLGRLALAGLKFVGEWAATMGV